MKTHSSKNIPIYIQIIEYLKSGFAVLDESVQLEIKTFLNRQQNKNGGFTDRAGNADLYYSLFGFWLGLATNNSVQLEKFSSFINNQNKNKSLGAVEQMALVLINAELLKPQKSKSLFSLVKTVFVKGEKIGFSYQFFLLTLAIDAQNRNNSISNFFARICLFFYKPKGNLPCSIMAALTFARHKIGLSFKNEQEKLLAYYTKEGGFKAFDTVLKSDILSTAVALFVLRETSYDLRIIAPGCLNFVQQNYDEGAFLSGDGDTSRDLEYTFYGLLALGTLIKDGK